MKIYDFLGIRVGSMTNYPGDLSIISTDGKVVEWITKQIKDVLPSVQVYQGAHMSTLIKNTKLAEQTNSFCLNFQKMNDQQYAFSVWLVQELCHQGWEPFGDTHFSYDQFDKITLRRCQES